VKEGAKDHSPDHPSKNDASVKFSINALRGTARAGIRTPARRMHMRRLGASLVLAAVLALLPAQAASADVLDLSAGVFPDD
jgi:hypothetical protein